MHGTPNSRLGPVTALVGATRYWLIPGRAEIHSARGLVWEEAETSQTRPAPPDPPHPSRFSLLG